MLAAEAMGQNELVSSVSGAAFAISKQLFELLGGFDGSFFLYVEDNDLSWRAQLAGYDCQYVPESVVYHRYQARFDASKYFYLERNRYQMLLKNLRWRSIVLLLPALALTEAITWGYAFLQGREHVAAKLRTYRWLLGHRLAILEARQKEEKRRKGPDGDLLSRCSPRLAYGLASDRPIARAASFIFDPIFLALHRICLAVA